MTAVRRPDLVLHAVWLRWSTTKDLRKLKVIRQWKRWRKLGVVEWLDDYCFFLPLGDFSLDKFEVEYYRQLCKFAVMA